MGKGISVIANALNAEALGSGFTLDADGNVTFDTASIDWSAMTAAVVDVSADEFPFVDATTGLLRRESYVDLGTALAGAGMTSASGALNVIAGAGVVVTADAVSLDLSTVTAAVFAPGADSLAFLDATGSATRLESWSDLAGLMVDGVTITSSAGVISVAARDYVGSVRAATTAALAASTYANGTAGVGATLTADANGALAAVDGVTLIATERVLVKDQVAGLQNGVYTVTQVGTAGTPFILTRATDFDSAADITPSAVVSVEEGTANDNTAFILTTNATITVGTTALAWSIFGGQTAGAGIAISAAGVVTSDLSTVTGAVFNAAADSIAFLDSDGNATRLELWTDLATTVAGDGLLHTAGVFGVDVSDFAGTGLEDDGAENLRLAAPGTGLTGGAGSALAVLGYTARTTTVGASLAFLEGSDNGTSTATVKAADALAGDAVITLPGVTGTLLLDSRAVNTGAGLSGGGALSSDLTLSVVGYTAAGAGQPTVMRLYEDTANGANSVALTAPASTTDVVATLQAVTGTLALTFADLAGAAIDVAADSIAFLDATDAGMKAETVTDLVAFLAGAGLTSAAGVAAVGAGVGIAVNADDVRVKAALVDKVRFAAISGVTGGTLGDTTIELTITLTDIDGVVTTAADPLIVMISNVQYTNNPTASAPNPTIALTGGGNGTILNGSGTSIIVATVNAATGTLDLTVTNAVDETDYVVIRPALHQSVLIVHMAAQALTWSA